MDVEAFIDHIMADGKVTAEEKQELDRYLLEDGKISEQEREKLAELLAKIASGELEILD